MKMGIGSIGGRGGERVKPVNPCKDCTDRQIGCHSTCNKYTDYVEQNEKRKAQLREIQALDNALLGYERRKMARLTKGLKDK